MDGSRGDRRLECRREIEEGKSRGTVFKEGTTNTERDAARSSGYCGHEVYI